MRFAVLLFLIIVAVPLPARAQDFSMMADWAQGQMLNDNLQRNLGRGGHVSGPPVYATDPCIRTPANPGRSVAVPLGGHVPQTAVPAAPPRPIRGVTTAYRPSPAVRDRVRRQFVDFIRRTSGAQAAEAIGVELARRDYLALWATGVARDGLKPDDVADVLAEYWVQNWQMANAVDYAPPARVRAVREQVRRTMLAKPDFARLDDARKQEMAEIFIYNELIQTSNYLNAAKRGDHATMQRIADASVARFRNEMHVDLRRLTLTNRGFAMKG